MTTDSSFIDAAEREGTPTSQAANFYADYRLEDLDHA
jgi:hypothetical protein